MHLPTVSNGQADRAGERFREWMRASPEERDETFESAVEAVAVIRRYRDMHAYPLRKVTMGVRTMIQTELGVGAPRPGQRFKRMDRILPKLLRFPTIRRRSSPSYAVLLADHQWRRSEGID